jgi:predicted RNase H-like HicB family nuclease
MKREYTVIIERDETGGYVGEIPGIAGCHSQGETVEELMENMREVLELCLDGLPKKEIPGSFVGVKKIALQA